MNFKDVIMVLRSKQQWLDLFDKHEASGLTAAAFCRDEGLCARYFSKRKKDLGWRGSVPIKKLKKHKVVKSKPSSDFIQVSVSKSVAGLSIQYGELRLCWEQLPPSDWLCELIKQLK